MIFAELSAFFAFGFFQIGAAETEACESAGSRRPCRRIGDVEGTLFRTLRILSDERRDESAVEIVPASRGVSAQGWICGKVFIDQR